MLFVYYYIMSVQTDIVNQNANIEKVLNEINNTSLVDDKKFEYKQQSLMWYQNTNAYLLGIYYFLLIVIAIFIYYKGKYTYFKIAIIIFMIFYPYIILKIQDYISVRVKFGAKYN